MDVANFELRKGATVRIKPASCSLSQEQKTFIPKYEEIKTFRYHKRSPKRLKALPVFLLLVLRFIARHSCQKEKNRAKRVSDITIARFRQYFLRNETRSIRKQR